jgi:hypothetical protein
MRCGGGSESADKGFVMSQKDMCPGGPRRSNKLLQASLGCLFLVLSILVASLTWLYLIPLLIRPGGDYPVILVSLPSLPLVLLALHFFGKVRR